MGSNNWLSTQGQNRGLYIHVWGTATQSLTYTKERTGDRCQLSNSDMRQVSCVKQRQVTAVLCQRSTGDRCQMSSTTVDWFRLTGDSCRTSKLTGCVELRIDYTYKLEL